MKPLPFEKLDPDTLVRFTTLACELLDIPGLLLPRLDGFQGHPWFTREDFAALGVRVCRHVRGLTLARWWKADPRERLAYLTLADQNAHPEQYAGAGAADFQTDGANLLKRTSSLVSEAKTLADPSSTPLARRHAIATFRPALDALVHYLTTIQAPCNFPMVLRISEAVQLIQVWDAQQPDDRAPDTLPLFLVTTLECAISDLTEALARQQPERRSAQDAATQQSRPDAVRSGTPVANPPGESEVDGSVIALMRVFTNGVSDDRIRQAARLLDDDKLTVNEKLTKIDALIPIPATASAEQLGQMLGVTKQAVLKTEWWIQNRKGERQDEIGRRRVKHQERAKDPQDDGQQG